MLLDKLYRKFWDKIDAADASPKSRGKGLLP